jgi:hypothetical protein
MGNSPGFSELLAKKKPPQAKRSDDVSKNQRNNYDGRHAQ